MPSKSGGAAGNEDTYFTCTLGQATLYNEDLKFKNIPTFLDELVKTHGDKPAVGFWDVNANAEGQNGGGDADGRLERKDHTIYTFAEAISHSNLAARYINQLCGTPTSISDESRSKPAAMLVRSVPDFLFCFLGLIRLGRPVLLLAPQLSGSAIATLCQQCEAELLYEGGAYDELVKKATEAAESLDGFELKTHRLDFQSSSSDVATTSKDLVDYSASSNDTAYLHHTSGTSTGLPKPIPQSHNAGCGVQPRLNGIDAATFTTTPLYHGGVADLFRAWTSGAMMWLFPGDKLPITAKNVSRCLEVAASALRSEEKEGEKVPKVKYFSSVPYVLQGMADHPLGLSQLQTMSIVGVGGAALPAEVGDELVKQGVPLISRFGSAECGFLMSSHRPFATDTEWQYLRPGSRGSKYLRFEPREEDGLCELIILPGWPHMAKTNREDGSFATSDLFERHESIPDAWRYHSRADSQLTLVTGKKFDPAPLEAGIAASSPLIGDVLIFGNGKPYPGMLVFRAEEARDMEEGEFERDVWKVVEKFNREGQSHTRISRGMVVLLGREEKGLEKSSKGTVIRRVAEERFEQLIERAYGKGEGTGGKEVGDEDVLEEVRRIVEGVMGSETKDGEKLTDTVDLFTYGADSVSCIQIRQKLLALLGQGAGRLPPTIVEDCGSIQILSQTILDIRQGKASTNGTGDDQAKLMQDFVETYSTLTLSSLPSTPSETRPAAPSQGKTILLTGSTGSLGSHLLSQLLSTPSVSHIHLLLRGTSLESSRTRLLSLLSSRHLTSPPNFDEKVTLHLYTLTSPHLGLEDEVYLRLAKEVDIIYDLAWSVNFLLPLRGFKAHFQALQSLLSLATAHAQFSSSDGRPARLVFCSSTASVASYPSLPGSQSALIPEEILSDVEASGGIGYSRSKWVAENILSCAVEKFSVLKGCVSVVRVGQISGDTKHGVWNKSEAYPLMLASASVTGCLPRLRGEKVGWTGVDVAAGGFVSLLDGVRDGKDVRVLHLLNPERPVGWDEVVGWIGEVEEGVESVEVGVWLERLEGLRKSEREEERSHPCLKLLEFWRGAYGGQNEGGGGVEEKGGGEGGSVDRRPQAEGFAMSKSIKAMPGLKEAKAVDREYVLKLWEWIKENV
ncbi:acetyl-CoA synthetase-like protein [Zymoseptoria brevis]|uniref:Acetyl-CoA synthetase-like protein n=1 Tax=Zymoseptoria brevis TaxID=1047168 RepID=A0A0F4GI46_9PEZI|nr:acetyl-CoA synthetase-like protein [Zymoseptoria brevis]